MSGRSEPADARENADNRQHYCDDRRPFIDLVDQSLILPILVDQMPGAHHSTNQEDATQRSGTHTTNEGRGLP